METIKANPQIKQFLNTRKGKFHLHKTKRAINTASFWDGGSRNQYVVYNLKTGGSKAPPKGIYPTFQAEYELQENEIMVKTGIFMGKSTTPAVYVNDSSEELFKQKFKI